MLTNDPLWMSNVLGTLLLESTHEFLKCDWFLVTLLCGSFTVCV